MNRLISAALVLTAIVLSSALFVNANDKKLKKEFKTIYAELAEHSRNKDVKALMRFNTDDYSVKLRDGKAISSQQLAQGVTRYFASEQFVRQIAFTYTIMEITRSEDEVIVLVEQKDKRIQIRRDGKPHEVIANVIHKDIWIKTSEGWRRKLTEELKQTKFTVDGKDESGA